VMMGEEKRDEYGDIVGGPKISKKQKAKNLAKNEKDEKITRSEETISELKTRTMLNYIDKASDSASKQLNKAKKFEKKGKLKKAGQARAKMDQREKGIAMAKDKIVKRQEDKTLTSLKRSYEGPDAMREAYSSKPSNLKKKAKLNAALKRLEDLKVKKRMSEETIIEDDMKGMSVKSGHKRPTKAGAGMTQKGVEAYRRRNPGSKLKTAVTGKVKKGSKAAKRRKSYCARSAGQMKKFPKAAKDPNSRLRQARRRWKC